MKSESCKEALEIVWGKETNVWHLSSSPDTVQARNMNNFISHKSAERNVKYY